MSDEPQVNYCLEGTHEKIRADLLADLRAKLEALPWLDAPGAWVSFDAVLALLSEEAGRATVPSDAPEKETT